MELEVLEWSKNHSEFDKKDCTHLTLGTIN